MSDSCTAGKRRLPLSPNLEQLKKQARDLLRAYAAGEAEAVADFAQYHPRGVGADQAKLTDAQLVLARSYWFPSWPRLTLGARLSGAIAGGDLDETRRLLDAHPELRSEPVRGIDSSWGPPLSFAANLGQDAVIDLVHGLGADDVQFAFNRAALQGEIDTARKLAALGAKPERGIVMGPCETVNGPGLEFLVDELGAELVDSDGDRIKPLGLVLETYCRDPEGKHRCLALFERHGVVLPDTPVMAFHQGRIDRLEEHLRRDPDLLGRRFSYDDLYPPDLRVGDDTGLHGTPLHGTTLLHMAVDFDEAEIFAWLLEKGTDVNVRAALDGEGFGGHTPLFNAVVSQATVCGRQKDAALARTLLERGADPNAVASIRKNLQFTSDDREYRYRDVTPLAYGRQFHNHRWINPKALEEIEARGGRA